MKRLAITAAALLLAACGGPTPEPGSPAPDGPLSPEEESLLRLGSGRVTSPPIYGLIGERERLKLTSAQVTALDSIAVDLSARNREANERLRTEMGRGRRPSRRDMQRVLPMMRELAENNRRATEGVEALLDDEQKKIACEVESEAAGSLASAQRAGPRPMFGGNTSRADSVAAARRGRAWTWCGPTLPLTPVSDTSRAVPPARHFRSTEGSR